MTYWLYNGKRFDDQREAVKTLLNNIADFVLVDEWNGYCYETKQPSRAINWTRDICNWFDCCTAKEVIETANLVKDIDPNHQWFVETKDGVKSSNNPARENWIDFDELADYLIQSGIIADYETLIEVNEQRQKRGMETRFSFAA